MNEAKMEVELMYAQAKAEVWKEKVRSSEYTLKELNDALEQQGEPK